MSLAELTRNCFQSGISAPKWLSLCKLLISKHESSIQAHDAVESNLSNSILVLHRSYPGDPDLHEYFKVAIEDGSLSLRVFIPTFLQAARSPELHSPAVLSTLCRIALDAHYSSGLPPIGSIVPYNVSPLVVLGTIQDALALLRTAFSLSNSHFHQLTASASELVILLLSCLSSDLSQVSTAQAMVHFADANDLLQNFRLASDVRQVLESFVISLSLVIGDDAKAAREAQIFHNIQLAFGKGNSHGHNAATDIITFGLIFNHLVSYRAHDFGSGDGTSLVALLVALFRWASWSPKVFYTQMILSALICLSQCSSNALVWKAFILGRLVKLLPQFEAVVNADGVGQSDWRRAIQTALVTCFQHSDLISKCDHVITRAKGLSSTPDEDTPRSFSRDILHAMIRAQLIDLSSAIEIDPLISNDNPARLQDDAQDANLDIESYLGGKLVPDLDIGDLRPWVVRLWQDFDSHSSFATVALRHFISYAVGFDVEPLSYMCKIFYTYEATLDIMALHIKISDLIFHALLFLEQYDCETVGDPQTAVSHLGDVVLFVQYTISRFHETDTVQLIERLSGEDSAAFSAWFKALFDSSSEGIEDSILRSTKPKTLLRISATLFTQAIKANLAQKLDGDILNNGVSYFTGPLLNWTLVGIVKALVQQIQHRGLSAPIYLEILQNLLLSSSCPRPVLTLCGPQVLLLFSEKKDKAKVTAPGIDVSSLRSVITGTLEPQNKGHVTTFAVGIWEEPKQAIQAALALARTGKAPVLDVERCIKIMPPTKFLQLLWSELVVSASLGETESCKRIATFVLTMPRSPNAPPLLPIFLHVVSPWLISTIEHQQPPEYTMNVELLVAIISSALTAALHLELAMRSVTGEHRFILGEPSSGMIRKFTIGLRAKKASRTSRAIAQSLISSQSFVANFPVFMSELG